MYQFRLCDSAYRTWNRTEFAVKEQAEKDLKKYQLGLTEELRTL